LVVLFEYDGVRVLFTGDAGKQGLSQAIEFAESQNINLKDLTSIKMPHHGSRKNVSPEIMDKLGEKGTSCYISCVKGDEGHHPSKRLVNMLIEKGFNVYLTAGTAHRYQHNDPPHRDGYSPSEPLHPYEKIEGL
jgi:beta-lactamase superfamily II metal-dependent hydrolase